MKKIFWVVALMISCAGIMHAQPKPDPKLLDCRAGLDREHKGLLKEYEDGVRAKKMSKSDEVDLLKALDGHKSKWASALKDGDLKECNEHRANVKNLQTRLKEMQAVNGKIVQVCFAEFKKTAEEADKIFVEAMKSKTLDEAEIKRYETREKYLKTTYDKALKDGSTLDECNALLKEARSELVAIAKAVKK